MQNLESIEDGEIGEEKLNEVMAQKFPDPSVNGMMLRNFKKIAFTFAHNIYSLNSQFLILNLTCTTQPVNKFGKWKSGA